jgi:2-dehydropantoate 2-reductase
MDIAVVGAGAMGGLFSAFLHEAGHDVVLVDKNPEKTRAITDQGLFIEGVSGDRTVHVAAVADPSAVGPRSLVLVCVKSYDTVAVSRAARPMVGPDTTVVTVQNGLGNVETLAQAFDSERVLGGTTSHGATVINWGYLRHAGKGETVLGCPGGRCGDRLDRIVELFRAAGIETRATDDLVGLIWSKLVVNVGINALTALLRVKNGVLVENEHARNLLRRAVTEAIDVVRAKGIRLLYDDAIGKVESVARATATNRSSMLQDALAGKRTEIDYINGAIVREADAIGLPAPVNLALSTLVRAMSELRDRVETTD